MYYNLAMIAHFIGSRAHILDEIEYYRTVVVSIKASGYDLTYDWVEEAYEDAKSATREKPETDWETIDKRFESAVQQADVVIVDATLKGFFVGYRAAQAVAQKKPLLILTRDASSNAVTGITTPTGYIKSVIYTKKSLKESVQKFLEENVIDTKDLRFNFFLDRRTFGYLRWMSLKTGKTKAEIMRSLIQKEMDSNN